MSDTRHDIDTGETAYEFISVSWAGSSESGKTQKYTVTANRDLALLGTIKWFGRWRQYAFYPEGGTIYSRGCMADIIEFIELIQ